MCGGHAEFEMASERTDGKASIKQGIPEILRFALFACVAHGVSLASSTDLYIFLQVVNRNLLLVTLFSERLRARRLHEGLTQEQLAATCGFSPSSITAWERAVNPPGAEKVGKLASALHTTVAWLMGESHEESLVKANSAKAQMLRDEQPTGPWRLLSERALRGVLSDLSAYKGNEETVALHHMGQIIDELRRRSENAITAAGEALLESAIESMSDEHPEPSRSRVADAPSGRIASPKPGADAAKARLFAAPKQAPIAPKS
jgi:transcriptional regulator with XRE-family HTH domain